MKLCAGQSVSEFGSVATCTGLPIGAVITLPAKRVAGRHPRRVGVDRRFAHGTVRRCVGPIARAAWPLMIAADAIRDPPPIDTGGCGGRRAAHRTAVRVAFDEAALGSVLTTGMSELLVSRLPKRQRLKGKRAHSDHRRAPTPHRPTDGDGRRRDLGSVLHDLDRHPCAHANVEHLERTAGLRQRLADMLTALGGRPCVDGGPGGTLSAPFRELLRRALPRLRVDGASLSPFQCGLCHRPSRAAALRHALETIAGLDADRRQHVTALSLGVGRRPGTTCCLARATSAHRQEPGSRKA
jgi:hypothetical protein